MARLPLHALHTWRRLGQVIGQVTFQCRLEIVQSGDAVFASRALRLGLVVVALQCQTFCAQGAQPARVREAGILPITSFAASRKASARFKRAGAALSVGPGEKYLHKFTRRENQFLSVHVRPEPQGCSRRLPDRPDERQRPRPRPTLPAARFALIGGVFLAELERLEQQLIAVLSELLAISGEFFMRGLILQPFTNPCVTFLHLLTRPFAHRTGIVLDDVQSLGIVALSIVPITGLFEQPRFTEVLGHGLDMPMCCC